MMKFRYLILMIIPLILLSCVDEDEYLGMNLVEDSDRLGVYKHEVENLSAFLFHEGDSLKTSNYRFMTLGSYTDNEFGSLSSSIFTQVSMSSTSNDFSSNIYSRSDSLVLTLAYSGLFSQDTNTLEMDMNIEVYEITEDFIDSLSYYSNSELSYSSSPIFSSIINISPKESVVLGGDTVVPHLRINLGNGFMNKILDYGSIANNTEFKTKLKGFYIKATPSGSPSSGMIVYFDMYSSYSGMSLYYRDGNDKTLRYNFLFDDKSRRFTNVQYDFSISAISSLGSLSSYNDSLDCQSPAMNHKIYLGNLGISYAKLNIDSLNVWYEEDTQDRGAFNQAMLIIPVDEAYSNSNIYYNFPTRLIAYRKNDDGNFVYIHDAFSDDGFDGKYDPTTNSYKMRITSHLQNYLNGNITDPNIYIFSDSRMTTASRVVLNGPNHSTKPSKIEIIYTR